MAADADRAAGAVGELPSGVASVPLAAGPVIRLAGYAHHAVVNDHAVAQAKAVLGDEVVGWCASEHDAVLYARRAVADLAALRAAADAAAAGSWARSSRLRVAMAGRLVPRETYVRREVTEGVTVEYVDETRLRDLVVAGSTLVIDGVDELVDPIGPISDGLAHVSGAACHANLYRSFSSRPGFRLHQDQHDTLLVQLEGAKRWQVHEPTPVTSGEDTGPPPTGSPSWEGTLAAGDVLLVPAGWWHEGTAETRPSIHVTFGIRRPTVREALQWLVAVAPDEALGRRLVLDRDSSMQRFDDDALRSTPLELYCAYRNGTTMPRLDLAAVTKEAGTAQAKDRLVPRTPRRVSVFDAEGRATLLAGGRAVSFPASLVPIVDEALRSATTCAALYELAPRCQGLAMDLIGALVAASAVTIDG